MEDLSWVPNSKWDQARTQSPLTDKANSKGLRVRKINPKNTSQDCVKCGSKVARTSRTATCKTCLTRLNRDVLGSRNVGLKVYPVKFSLLSRNILPPHTLVAVPATPGVVNYVALTRNTT